MKKLLALALLLLAVPAFGEVGTTTVTGPFTVEKSFNGIQYRTQVYIYDCLSHTDGTLSAGEAAVIKGKIVQVAIDPDSGDTAPTTLFDVTAPATGSITADSVTTSYTITDVLAGTGANLSETTTTVRTPLNTDGFPMIMNGESVTISASGVGSANGFTVIITTIP